MAIKYVHIPEKKQTVAILENTCYGVTDKIEMINNKAGLKFYPDLNKYLLNNRYRATVTCDERDTYDEHIGEEEARKKVLKKYYKAVDKRYNDYLKDIYKLLGVAIDNIYYDQDR